MTIKTTAITGLTALTLAAGSSLALADSDPAGNAKQETAASKTQGMYSASRLMDASVYAKGDQQHAIGEIHDVLLGNDMKIRSFVVETKGKFGVLGGKSYVVPPDHLTVQTQKTGNAKKPDYRVELDMSRDQLGDQPVYSASWLSNAQSEANSTWEDTKKSASSAWTKMKDTTSNLMHGARDKAGDAAQSTSDAAHKAGDKASDAAHKAGDKASGND